MHFDALNRHIHCTLYRGRWYMYAILGHRQDAVVVTRAQCTHSGTVYQVVLPFRVDRQEELVI
jgi:hypothetical protein